MIKITVKDNDEIIVEGHASEKCGKKATEACASVTALTQNLLIGITFVCHKSQLHVIEPGFFALDIKDLNSDENCKTLIDTFKCTVKKLAATYQECITVIEID